MPVPSSVGADKHHALCGTCAADESAGDCETIQFDNDVTNVPIMKVAEANCRLMRLTTVATLPSLHTESHLSSPYQILCDICSIMIATRAIVLRRGHASRGISLISSRAHRILKTPAIANESAMASSSRRTHQLMRTRHMSTSEREKAIAAAENSASLLEKAAANTESITPRPTRRQLRLHCLWEAVPMFTFGE